MGLGNPAPRLTYASRLVAKSGDREKRRYRLMFQFADGDRIGFVFSFVVTYTVQRLSSAVACIDTVAIQFFRIVSEPQVLEHNALSQLGVMSVMHANVLWLGCRP